MAGRPEPEVEAANARFYQAFEELDLGAMDGVWAHAEYVKCVHPGWPLLTGWDAVRESWRVIFENTAEIRFTLADVEATATGNLAWVTCTENILQSVRDRISVTSILSTNLFERGPDGTWRIIHHHASIVMGAPDGPHTPDAR
jgi:ketosteroid isomerase-like protein